MTKIKCAICGVEFELSDNSATDTNVGSKKEVSQTKESLYKIKHSPTILIILQKIKFVKGFSEKKVFHKVFNMMLKTKHIHHVGAKNIFKKSKNFFKNLLTKCVLYGII